MAQYEGQGFKEGLTFENDKFTITHTENITPVLKRNHMMREGRIMRPKNDFGHLVGSIPETVYAGLLATRPDIAHDMDALTEFLNSEEGKQYKTLKGGI